MRIDGGLDRRPAVVTDAEHADATIGVGDILREPVDRVEGVRAFVKLELRIGRAQWALHHERAFRAKPAPDVLEHKYVTVFGEFLQVAREVPRPVGDAVRSAQHDERQRLGVFVGGDDDRVQLRAIAHREHVLRRGVTIEQGLLRSGLLGRQWAKAQA